MQTAMVSSRRYLDAADYALNKRLTLYAGSRSAPIAALIISINERSGTE